MCAPGAGSSPRRSAEMGRSDPEVTARSGWPGCPESAAAPRPACAIFWPAGTRAAPPAAQRRILGGARPLPRGGRRAARDSDLRALREAARRRDFADFVRRQAPRPGARRADVVGAVQGPAVRLRGDRGGARFRAPRARRAAGREAGDVTREAAALDEMVAGQSRLAIDMWASSAGAVPRIHARRRHGRARAAARAQPHHAAGVPADPPLLPRPARARRRAREPRLPAQPRARRRQHGVLADRRRWPSAAGYVFIRRSFGDDQVYKLGAARVLRLPASRKRFNLEWYIEGGRTRTGKLRPPRYGLLAYVVEALPARAASRTSTSCRCRSPTTSCTRSARWPPSRAARASAPRACGWLVGYARAQGRNARARARRASASRCRCAEALATPSEERRPASQKVAFEVCHRINRVTPVTATALVTLALLGVRDRALTLAQVQRGARAAARLPRRARDCPVPASCDVRRHGRRAARARARSSATAW